MISRSMFGFVLATMGLLIVGCASSAPELRGPVTFIKPNQRISIIPFEVESMLSNFGGQLSDEVTINLLKNAPQIPIVPASQVKSFLQTSGIVVGGLPDDHSIHKVKDGLKCRYMLTGNLYANIGDVRYTKSYNNRVASGSVTIRLIDCDSERVVWATREETSATSIAYYSEGQQLPTYNYETDGQLMQRLIKRLGSAVSRHFYAQE